MAQTMSGRRRPYDRAIWRAAVRPAVFARDGYRCQVFLPELGRKCGRHAGDVGHRVALVDGGEPYQLVNLEAQCAAHNRGEGARLAARRSCRVHQSRRW
jgi:5-methylcytosine-specific restriction endonuclease McrA